MRNRVKRPSQFSRAHVVSAHVAGRRRQSFRISRANDQQILVDDSGRRQRRPLRLRIASQIFAQIDSALRAEPRNRLARGGIERVNEVHHGDEDALVLAARPVRQAAVGLRAAHARIELPPLLARGRVEREYLLRRRDSEKHAVDDQRARFQAPRFAGVERPRHVKLFHIVAIDLRERRIVRVLRVASVNRPVPARGFSFRLRPCSVRVGRRLLRTPDRRDQQEPRRNQSAHGSHLSLTFTIVANLLSASFWAVSSASAAFTFTSGSTPTPSQSAFPKGLIAFSSGMPMPK